VAKPLFSRDLAICPVSQPDVRGTLDNALRADPRTRPVITSLYVLVSMIDKGVLWTSAEISMGRRDLLTDDERRALFGVPEDHAALVRLYTLSRADLDTIRARRGDANRLGTAVQLALLRHPGLAFANGVIPAHLVAFMAAQIGVPTAAFAGYGNRSLCDALFTFQSNV